MAVVNQLNLNVGTEQNPNFVLHDINDKRISTTAVTTATHLLTCNSGVTSIAPITAANLASVLGGDGHINGYLKKQGYVEDYDFNTALDYGLYYITNGENWVNGPSGITKDQALLLCYGWSVNERVIHVLFSIGATPGLSPGIYTRIYKKNSNPEWTEWAEM